MPSCLGFFHNIFNYALILYSAFKKQIKTNLKDVFTGTGKPRALIKLIIICWPNREYRNYDLLAERLLSETTRTYGTANIRNYKDYWNSKYKKLLPIKWLDPEKDLVRVWREEGGNRTW